jgi:hypothetical protein
MSYASRRTSAHVGEPSKASVSFFTLALAIYCYYCQLRPHPQALRADTARVFGQGRFHNACGQAAIGQSADIRV